MTAVIGLIAIVVVALVGWGVAELKYKDFSYKVNKEEADGVAKELAHHAPTDEELGIKDVIRTISTKGYSAV